MENYNSFAEFYDELMEDARYSFIMYLSSF